MLYSLTYFSDLYIFLLRYLFTRDILALNVLNQAFHKLIHPLHHMLHLPACTSLDHRAHQIQYNLFDKMIKRSFAQARQANIIINLSVCNYYKFKAQLTRTLNVQMFHDNVINTSRIDYHTHQLCSFSLSHISDHDIYMWTELHFHDTNMVQITKHCEAFYMQDHRLMDNNIVLHLPSSVRHLQLILPLSQSDLINVDFPPLQTLHLPHFNDHFDFSTFDHLTCLKLESMNHRIHRLPASLQHLELRRYNKRLPTLPESLNHLMLYRFNRECITHLPSQLKTLDLMFYNHALPSLPFSLITLKLGDFNAHPLCIPSQVQTLWLIEYNKPFSHMLPDTLIDLRCRNYNQGFDRLPGRLQSLSLANHTAHLKASLPDSLQFVILPHMSSSLKWHVLFRLINIHHFMNHF